MKKKPLIETASDIWHSLSIDHEDPYETKKARVFAISAKGFTRILVESGDVYEALNECGNKVLSENEIGIGVETCGWASPINHENTKKARHNNELAPSQHPERKRVRLVCCVNTEMKAGSALGFADDNKLVTDEGTAKGSLADALIMAMKQMVVRNN